MEKNLYGYVSNITRDVDKNSVLHLIEEDRKQKLEMNPSSAFRNRKANSVIEKNNIIISILEDIKAYKIKSRELNDANRKLGTFLITNCAGCREEYELFKNSICLDKEGNPIEKTWANYFLYQDKDYCSETCEFNNLKERREDEFIENYNSLYDHRFKTLTEYNTLGIEYRVALEQKQSLLESFEKIIKTHKETVAILVFKKNDIQWHINIIQLSVIVVSTFITIFETSQTFLEQYVNKQILTIFPIVLSSYIGLILAIGRFFKYDDKNEKIIKLIEKYSFIINKFRQKSDNFEGFDFKLKDMKKWEELLDRDEKDNIGDILLKANEEKDLVLKPKEAVFYKKKYTKTRLKELIEGKNFNELGDLINKNEYPNMEITKLTQDIILKRNFCKYYCCFLWLCYDRDYVDYDKTVLKNVIFFLKSNDIYDKDKTDDILICDKDKTLDSNQFEMNKELKALVEVMQKKISTMEMEKEKEKKIERIREERNKEKQRKEIAKSNIRSRNDRMKSLRTPSRSPPYRRESRRYDAGISTSEFREGDKVEAKIPGWTKYFPGEITRVNSDDTYDIHFDDGERKKRVEANQIRFLSRFAKLKAKDKRRNRRRGEITDSDGYHYTSSSENDEDHLSKSKDIFMNGDKVIANIDGKFIACLVDRTLCRERNADGQFYYNLKSTEGNRYYHKVKGELIKKNNQENIKLVVRKKTPPRLLKRYLEEFEGVIWEQVKTHDTLEKGLKQIFLDLCYDSALCPRPKITGIMMINVLQKNLKEYDICRSDELKNVTKFIYEKIEDSPLGGQLVYEDFEKYFKNTFKQRIIDFKKTGFVDDCVIDISSNVITDISGNSLV